MEPSRPLPSEDLAEEELFSPLPGLSGQLKQAELTQLSRLAHDRKLQEVSILLLMLQKLKVNQKIIFQVPAIIDPHSLLDWGRRKYYQEDSNTNLDSLRKLVDDIEQLFQEGLTDNQRKSMLDDLRAALVGINTLFTTYNHNNLFCSHLTLILRRIDNFLRNVDSGGAGVIGRDINSGVTVASIKSGKV